MFSSENPNIDLIPIYIMLCRMLRLYFNVALHCTKNLTCFVAWQFIFFASQIFSVFCPVVLNLCKIMQCTACIVNQTVKYFLQSWVVPNESKNVVFGRSNNINNQLRFYWCQIPLDGSNWFWYIHHWTWVTSWLA